MAGAPKSKTLDDPLETAVAAAPLPLWGYGEPVPADQLLREVHSGQSAHRHDEVRKWFVKALFIAIVGQFAVAAALLIFSDTKWDEVKDLLAYGVAPFAAAIGVVAGYYFSASARA